MLKLLSETELYQNIDKDMKFTDKIMNFVKSADTRRLTEDDLMDVFYKIRHKSFDYPAKFAVIELFRKGVIEICVNDKIKLPTCIPFFRKKMPGGGYGVVVNITNFITTDKDGNIAKLDHNVLYALMLTGAMSLIADENISIIENGDIAELFGRLFASTINGITNINKDTQVMMRFFGTKFFYMQCGVDEQRAFTKAAKSVSNDVDLHVLKSANISFSVESFDSLEKLINMITKVYGEMKGLTFTTFFNKWLSNGEMTAFAIEYVPYFLTVIAALTMSINSMITLFTIESVASKGDKTKIAKTMERMEVAVVGLNSRLK